LLCFCVCIDMYTFIISVPFFWVVEICGVNSHLIKQLRPSTPGPKKTQYTTACNKSIVWFKRKCSVYLRTRLSGLWKNRPKCSPSIFFVKINIKHFRLKKVAQQFEPNLSFSRNCPKKTIAHCAKIRPIWSTCYAYALQKRATRVVPFSKKVFNQGARWQIFKPEIQIWGNWVWK
jgi:hypothetical protein